MPNDSCLLGSINLSEFVENEFEHPTFNFDEFERAVRIAVQAMNEVQKEDIDFLPLDEQKDVARNYRRIGLGIMGLADMFIKMGMVYGEPKSLDLLDAVMDKMREASIKESMFMAEYNGGPFPAYKEGNLCSHMYNSALISIAPTGTISTLLGVSGGGEPVYDLSYTRKTESLNGEDKYYQVYTPIVKKYMEKYHITDTSELPPYFVTAKNIDYKSRIYIQSVLQEYTDQGISSTINLPESTTVEDIEDLYKLAWISNLKGVTVYRDNCARTGILTSDTENETKEEPKHEIKKPVETPKNVVGKKRKLMTGCGALHCLAFFDRETGDLMEVYLGKGSTGGCNNYMNGLARMLSLSARSGAGIADIVDQLDSTGVCPSYAVRSAKYKDTSKGSCCPMAIGNALVDMYNEMQGEIEDGVYFEEIEVDEQDISMVQLNTSNKSETNIPTCPECGEPLVHEGGCDICKSCGYSKCS